MSFLIDPTAERDIAALQDVERAATEMFRGTGLLPDSLFDDPEVTARSVHLGYIANGVSLTARVGAAPVGFAIGRALPGSYYLAELSVHPAYGRQGIGRALVEMYCTTAFGVGASCVTLSTFRDVPWNRPFYASMGFREIARAQFTPWMKEYEDNQARGGLDVTKRCFMQRDAA